MKIKKLCLADGSEYDKIELEEDMDELCELLEGRGFLRVTVSGKSIAINSEYIVSIEF